MLAQNVSIIAVPGSIARATHGQSAVLFRRSSELHSGGIAFGSAPVLSPVQSGRPILRRC
jgi:hypothetical protein